MNASLRIIRRCLPAGLAALLLAASAQAQTKLVVGYQLIVGPFLTAIADGSMDAALKDAGYQVDRQFTSGGDISTALARAGAGGRAGLDRHHRRRHARRGPAAVLLDNIGKSEALVARNGSGIASTADLKGKRVATPFVDLALPSAGRAGTGGRFRRATCASLNMQPPQIVAAWARARHRRAYVPPALTEIAKSGKIIADSEQIGKASVPTFDGLVADRAWAEKNPKFMAAFTGVMAKSYAAYRANPAAWTADSPGSGTSSKLIGSSPRTWPRRWACWCSRPPPNRPRAPGWAARKPARRAPMPARSS